QVNATYYASGVAPPAGGVGGLNTLAGTFDSLGHPSDAWGWAAMVGLRLNAPMIGVGDYLALQGIYTQGALRYLYQHPGAGNMWLGDNQSAMYGLMSDGVYGGNQFGGVGSNLAGTSVQLTTAWGVNAGYEHFWNPAWRTSLYGGYAATSYNGTANALVCT